MTYTNILRALWRWRFIEFFFYRLPQHKRSIARAACLNPNCNSNMHLYRALTAWTFKVHVTPARLCFTSRTFLPLAPTTAQTNYHHHRHHRHLRHHRCRQHHQHHHHNLNLDHNHNNNNTHNHNHNDFQAFHGASIGRHARFHASACAHYTRGYMNRWRQQARTACAAKRVRALHQHSAASTVQCAAAAAELAVVARRFAGRHASRT